MSKRLTVIVEDEVYDELVALSDFFSVAIAEYARRGLDIVLGRNGHVAPPWNPPPDMEPRRPGVKFKR